MNSHLKTVDGREFTVFASFFRMMLDYNEKEKKFNYGHSITWAIYDDKEKIYSPVSLIDKRAPEIGLKNLKAGKIVKDNLLRKAGIELLEKGVVPLPDKLLTGDPKVSLTSLHLDFDGNEFKKLEDGRYQLHLYDEEQKIGADFILDPQKPVTRHGDNGVVRGVGGEDMFYYFIPRCNVEGSVTIENKKLELAEASGWYDHEFGKKRELAEDDQVHDVAWNWISTQLDNGCELTAYDLFDVDHELNSCGRWAIFIDENGNRQDFTDFELIPQNSWTSTRTFNDYPTKWKLKIHQLGLELDAEAPHDQQEFITIISKPAFWEGRVNVKGTMNGKEVAGPGFVERSGFEPRSTMGDILKTVGRETQKSIKNILPLTPDKEKLAWLVAHKDKAALLDGIDLEQYINAVVKPIRTIIDRGGKTWRSYSALACCDIVGGNSQPIAHWLSLPELLHVGSLIVDDVEDKSKVRRGGPTCHEIYGEAIAINAGCAAYFLGQICAYSDEVTIEQKVKIYNIYFEAQRAAHAGQALDINGLAYLMPEIVESGNGQLLEKRILTFHKLKTAVPAGYMA
jgi:hypothetical protein